MAILSVIWGGSFILIKKGLIALEPTQVAAIRVGIAALTMIPFLIVQYKKLPKGKLKYLLLVGLFGNGFPAILYPIAQQHVDSSVAGILNSLTPLSAFILGLLFFNVPFVKNKMIGVLVGLCGAIALVVARNGLSMEDEFLYVFLILLATMCYGASVNIVHRYLSDVPAILITGTSLFMVGIPAIIFFFLLGTPEVIVTHPEGWLSFASICALGVLSTAFASIFFYKLVQVTDAIWAAQVAYLIPIVALFFGIFDGEFIGWPHVVGMGLILVGIYISRTKNAVVD